MPLVTEAQRPLSEDIAYRQRRYLIMMGIRGVSFAAAVALFVYVPGFFWAIPVVGAIIINSAARAASLRAPVTGYGRIGL